MIQTISINLTTDELSALIESAVSKVMSGISTQAAPTPIKQHEYLTVPEAAELLRMKQSTVYTYVCRRKINYIKRSGKVMFRRSDLLTYLDSGRHLTSDEIKAAI